MEFEELTLEDLEESPVGQEVPILVDWISKGQITTKTVKVKVAEPAIAEKITQKYMRADRGGKMSMPQERQKLYQAELFQHFLVTPSLKNLGLKAIEENVIPKFPVSTRLQIEKVILGNLEDVITLEEDTLKNFAEDVLQDTSGLDSQPSTSDNP